MTTKGKEVRIPKGPDLLSPSLKQKEKIMEVFRWVKAMLLATVLASMARLFSQGLGYDGVAQWSGYFAVAFVAIGGVLTLVGVAMDRKRTKKS